jgi:hypothetical protein
MDIALHWLDMIGIVMACLKYHSFSIFKYILTIQILFHVVAWIHLTKSMRGQANFCMDIALHWLDMVGIVMACLKYHSFSIF